jgi:hypothetical protein
MTITQYKRLTIALVVAVVLSLALNASLFWKYARQHLEVAFAAEQTEIYEEMRARALQSDPAGAASSLEYAVRYYPSGTKQRTGSHLDRIVERERARAVRDIVAHLRQKTGQDLGEDPEKWIERFARK